MSEALKIAADALRNRIERSVPPIEEKGVQPPPQPSGVPAYPEPLGSDDLRAQWAEVFPDGSATLTGATLNYQRMQEVLNATLDRVTALERALRPFAMQAAMLAQARMMLMAAQRGDEPAGGTWVSGPSRINLQATESIFFDACDVYGRRRTEAALEARFNELQDGLDAAKERRDTAATEH